MKKENIIGANANEALYGISKADFITKLKRKFKLEHDGKLYCEVCGFDLAMRSPGRIAQ